MKHFAALLFAVAAVGQVPGRFTQVDIFDRPNSKILRQQFASSTHNFFAADGTLRMQLSSGGSGSTVAGILTISRGTPGSEVLINRLDRDGIRSWATILGANVQGEEMHTRVADGRLVISNITNTPASAGATAFGQTIWTSHVSGVAHTAAELGVFSGGGALKLYNVGTATPFLTVDTDGIKMTGTFPYWSNGFSGTTSTPCPTGEFYAPGQVNGGLVINGGCASLTPSGSFVTLDTAQTITGAKIFKSAITVEDALSSIDRSVLGSGTLNLNNTSGAGRVLASSSNSLDSGTGIVRVFTGAAGAETTVAEMAAGGVNVNAPAVYRYNGTGGTSVTCGSGQYLALQSVAGGITTGGTCTSLPAAGGDMLLGTSQTVTALKTFQMTFGGDAIRVNNTAFQLRGAWSDATLSIGDIASGSGRGVQLATGGTLQIFNASSQAAIRLSFSGTAGTIQVLDSGGTVRTGITQTCITTNGGQINFVAGIAYSCF